MSCTNCYNGCSEIISDKCVKYTGVDIPALGISNGDTLLAVENAITTFLVPILTGSGVKPTINELIICEVVQKYLPSCTICTGFTLNEVLTAIIKAVCDLQEQIDRVVADIAELNADYDVNCLSGVSNTTNTHDVLQATIDKLCELETDFNILLISLPVNYVTVENIDTYIEDYLNNSSSSLIKNKMVPYTVVPYYGPLNYFDGTGAGTGDWIDIYLCNGANPGVPDLRGRTLVGATYGMFGGPLDNEVNPNIPGSGNPSYILSGTIPPLSPSITGTNQVTLGLTQIPNHTHIVTATATVTEEGHRHKFSDDNLSPTNALRADNDIIPFVTTPTSALISAAGNGSGQIYETSKETIGITVDVEATASPQGGGLPHTNVQPSAACYYIIHIP